jgi:hypothetical protein
MTITKRISGSVSGAVTRRVSTGDVQADTYNPWGDAWRLGGSVKSCWGLTWIHRFARSVINVTDRLGSTGSVTANVTKRVKD